MKQQHAASENVHKLKLYPARQEQDKFPIIEGGFCHQQGDLFRL